MSLVRTVRIELEGGPDLRRVTEIIEAEIPQYPDHGIGFPPERDRASKHVRSPVEPGLPERLPEHDDTTCLGKILLGGEGAPPDDRGAKGTEEVG